MTFGAAQRTIRCAHANTEALGVQGGNPSRRRAGGSGCLARRPHKMSARLHLWDLPPHTPQEEAEETDITQRRANCETTDGQWASTQDHVHAHHPAGEKTASSQGRLGEGDAAPCPAQASGTPEGGAGPTACQRPLSPARLVTSASQRRAQSRSSTFAVWPTSGRTDECPRAGCRAGS